MELTRTAGDKRENGLHLRAATLVLVAYVALALPAATFIVDWCTLWLAAPAVVALAWGARCLPVADGAGAPHPSRSSTLFAMAIGTLGFCISGAGGVGPQGFDQIKHNSVLADLISHSWPVFFAPDQPLVYYVGYYILPALLGKAGGWAFANVMLALETWILYVLAALWVMTLAKRHPKASLLLFVFFSGLDPIGNWIIHHEWAYNPWWARLQFSDPGILVISVPQHVAIGWIGAAAVLQSDRLERPLLAVAIWSVSPYWSPFVTLGLAPFVLYVWWRHRGFRDHALLQGALTLTVLVPAVLFFQARSPVLETYKWSTMGVPFSTFLLFIFLEWGLIALLLWVAEGRRLLTRSFALLAMLSLAVIPLVSFPGYTDYVARASIPALFFLALEVVAVALDGLRRSDPRVAALWVVLLIGALQPLAIYRQSVHRLGLTIPDLKSVSSLPQLGNSTGIADDGRQYVGRTNTPFFLHLAARRQPRS